MRLPRLVLDYRTGELVVRCLYRSQGFAAKTLPELDALAEPTGADA